MKLTKPRKLISWDYSFLVTLPLRWVEDNGLKKGDLIDFDTDRRGNLILVPVKNENAKTTYS